MTRPWFNLAEAAEELDVSPRTIRRWVRAGRLPAELRASAHGPQYFLSVESVRELAQARDVEVPPRRVDVEQVIGVVAAYFDARERDFQEQQDALREELYAVRTQLHQAYGELTRAQQALWQQCRELAETQRVMQRLGEDLGDTRARARATRELRQEQRSGRALPEGRHENA